MGEFISHVNNCQIMFKYLVTDCCRDPTCRTCYNHSSRYIICTVITNFCTCSNYCKSIITTSDNIAAITSTTCVCSIGVIKTDPGTDCIFTTGSSKTITTNVSTADLTTRSTVSFIGSPILLTAPPIFLNRFFSHLAL